MENFIFSLNATLPIFIVIIIGWILMQIGIFNKEFTTVADKYVFKVALPLYVFKDIATADIYEMFDAKFVIFCSVSTTLMFLGVWAFAHWYCRKDKSMIGAFSQAAARVSAAILGIAFVENIYGTSGMAPMMIVSAVPLYNIFAVIFLTFGAEDADNIDRKSNIKKAFINVIKNPIIIGIAAGAVFAFFRIPIPYIPLKVISNIGGTASPIALLVVGATFEGRKALAKIKPSVVATIIKLVIIPLIFFPFAILFGFRGSELVAILVMLGSPTTVSCYIMAKNMKNDYVLTSSIIVMATLLSSITLTAWIFVLKSMALI